MHESYVHPYHQPLNYLRNIHAIFLTDKYTALPATCTELQLQMHTSMPATTNSNTLDEIRTNGQPSSPQRNMYTNESASLPKVHAQNSGVYASYEDWIESYCMRTLDCRDAWMAT